MYLAYVIGIVIGPLAGKISNRLGSGTTLCLGAAVFALGIACTLNGSVIAVAAGLAAVCGGFFAIHAAAVGALNRRLTTSQGRANSLYVLFYYLGGAVGITISGYAYVAGGWTALAALGMWMLLIPFAMGVVENRRA